MTTFHGSTGRDRPAPVPQWQRWGMSFGYFQAAAILVALLTAGRLVVLLVADYNLGPDEAQYWSWSRDPAFGYFSKPPMIAWLIALTTGLLGDAEAAIRLSAPILHMGTALIVFALARDLYDDRIAFWSALVYATAPAVWFSSGLITTDVPLLLFWSLALWAFHRMLSRSGSGRGLAWAGALGLALGLGLMSKYAMLYFLLCAGLYLAVSREHRRLACSRHGLIAGLIAVAVAGVIVAPNVLWNLRHGLSTVEHTAANANWGTDLFNPGKLAEFIGAQFGVFGPLLFGALLWGLATLKRRLRGPDADAHVFLICFVLPILALVAGQSFVSRANANWAATAYVAAAIVVVAWLIQGRRGWWIVPASIGFHTAAAGLLIALILSPSLVDALGRTNDFKRVHGWDAIGAAVREIAQAGYEGDAYTALLTDDRLVHAELLYYARPHPQPVVTWETDGQPGNHYELTSAFEPSLGGNVLLVSRYERPEHILERFRSRQLLGVIQVPTGGERTRTLSLFVLQDPRQ